MVPIISAKVTRGLTEAVPMPYRRKRSILVGELLAFEEMAYSFQRAHSIADNLGDGQQGDG